MRKCLSVIVPVYNVEKYIDRCVESIVSQTYDNLQIILIDDGSFDESGRICDTWSKKDSRVQVIHQENGGLVSARLAGLRAAIGEYVGFVDSDDYIEPNMYEILIDEKECAKLDFVYCGLHNCYETEGGLLLSEDNTPEVIGVFDLSDNCADFLREHVFTMRRKNQIYTGGICLGVYDRERIMEAYSKVPLNCSQGEDFICQICMMLNATKIEFLPDILYHYRIRTGSVSDVQVDEKINQIYRMMREIKYNIAAKDNLDNLATAVDVYAKLLVALERNKYGQEEKDLFLFSEIDLLENCKVVLYAAGKVGKSYYNQFVSNRKIELVGWVDRLIRNEDVSSVDEIKCWDYDYVVIAVAQKSVAQTIKKELVQMGLDEQKLIWNLPYYNVESLG